ncbi:BCCT family transporter [Azoarcus sp. Aa7]|nr:BCCT family transporter [Azoarcus sp. Aa7]
MVVLLVVFMVTSVDSGALVVDNLAVGGVEDTPVPQRVLWVGLIAPGLPYMMLMLVLMVGFVKALIRDYRS